MTSGDVKLCIVCDSAISANVFTVIAIQVIQPMVLRLQDKHPGSKLTVGIVTYTTPTTRPAIVAKRAFTQAGALFPLFREAPHSIGIGTSGSGGTMGMAILEGLVAAIEMCDDVLEAPFRRQRIRHPNIPAQASTTPIFHVLLIGGSRSDSARRPFYNRSPSLDDASWDTLPDELKKRNINLSLCLSNPIKELVSLHTKLWPTPDPVWFPKPKGYTILLSGTHMANAKRQLEVPPTGPTQPTALKRSKIDSPKPTARPIPPKIELPAPVLTSPPPAPVPVLAPPPPPAPVPHPPSIPESPQPLQQPKMDSPLIASYHQLRLVMINSNTPPEQRAKLLQSGFRMDEHGAFVGPAGTIFDAKGQPGPGSLIPLRVHQERLKQLQLMQASASGNPAAQQALRMLMQQRMQQQAMGASGSGQALNPNLSPAPQPESNPSPTHHRSPSHIQSQPSANLEAQPHSGHAFQPGGGGVPVPGQQAPFHPAASPAHQPGGTPHMQPGAPPMQHGHPATPQQATGTPQHPISISTPQHASTPQHIGVTPPQGTPQLAHSTPKFANSTPKMAHSTPQMAHATPQMSHSTPQMAHSVPPLSQDQSMFGGGQQHSPPNTQGMFGPNVQGMPNGSQNPGGPPIQIPGALPNVAGTNSTQGTGSSGVPATTNNVWRGQIVYLLQQRPDQESTSLHFSAVAVGAPNKSIETHRWPNRLENTNGFKQLPVAAAAQLYNSQVPFGQISIDQQHAGMDSQKWQVFHRIVTAGYCIFTSSRPIRP
ncbi:hypothetical protein RSOL_204320 [Rhizoctonia solani AG-3 Rhs1AP]|uniref:Mediator of RNA polymerase II transcription subunit 25 n=1 Tax=Rhizoctonia solani AG-3 Rhs1AP TaxID=1086054 RepID=X8J4Q0_9AGAM|nr:hypothetical protein RSOL_204320 [Rhizoctonia solani AG-3 Rhs1AP]